MVAAVIDEPVVTFTEVWDPNADPHLHVNGPHGAGGTDGIVQMLQTWRPRTAAVHPARSDSALEHVLERITDALTLLHARAGNREDEPDATFPDVLVIVDDYDQVLRNNDTTRLAQLRRGVRQLIHEGAQAGIHLILTTSSEHLAIDDDTLHGLSTIALGSTTGLPGVDGHPFRAGEGRFVDHAHHIHRIRF